MPTLTFVFKCEVEVHINAISCCAEHKFIGFTAVIVQAIQGQEANLGLLRHS